MKFYKALVFNFAPIILLWLGSWESLATVRDEHYLMFHTWGWFSLIVAYLGFYFLLLVVFYTLFYWLGLKQRRKRFGN
ncbi:hypothetical protein [Pseudolactococcus hodotermopsidis]|uniref:hypothetical protein n=1 Tax=Pseudolactococcus hodotermopsidis TaxID=2709157 RepID=UPI0015540102|nr:hypothetical protein [Lactococcus hodotermopsidis]